MNRRSLVFGAVALALFASAPVWSLADDSALITELLDGADDIARSTSSVADMEMFVKTDRHERTMRLKAWSRGEDQSLIQILEPAKDAGVSTLRSGGNIWNYLPKVDRVMKVPSGMMSGSWMGSHFSNDDLVKSSRMSQDYTAKLAERPVDGAGLYRIHLTPKPTAPVVWGKVEVDISADKLPVEIRFFDEKGALVRTQAFSEVAEVSGRKVPMVFTLTPADKPGEITRMRYLTLNLDADVPASTFSLQALKAR